MASSASETHPVLSHPTSGRRRVRHRVRRLLRPAELDPRRPARPHGRRARGVRGRTGSPFGRGLLRRGQVPLRFPQFRIRNTTQASPGKLGRLPRTPAGSTHLALDGYGLRDQLLARPTKPASYPVSVRQVAVLLHASFRHHLAGMPLRFANPSPPSGWIEDFHFPATEHAGHTTKRTSVRSSGAQGVAPRTNVPERRVRLQIHELARRENYGALVRRQPSPRAPGLPRRSSSSQPPCEAQRRRPRDAGQGIAPPCRS